MRLLLMILLLWPVGAVAQVVDQYGIIVPPARFGDGVPYPVVPPNLHRASPRDIILICQKFGYQPIGCTVTMPNRDEKSCDIYIRDDMDGDYFKSVLSHEQAHCRGWGSKHPD